MNQRIDLTGQRFGKLLVLKKAENHNGKTMWKCKCDCGNFSIVSSHGLMTRDTKSCGCLRYNRINEIGNRYGKLLVIEHGEDAVYIKPSGKKSIEARWICRCDCERTILVRGHSLREGRTKSCGKCMPLGEAAFNAFYKKAMDNAIGRGYDWEISKEQVRYITSQPCFYCGSPPNQTYKTNNDRGGYIHNGIDRMENSIGYVVENLVPCCKTCNYAKHIMGIGEFRKWVLSVCNHWASR